VAVLQLGGGLIGLAITAVVSSLVMQIPTVWCIRRIAPELHFGWQGARRAAIWTVISFSSSLSIIHLAGRIQTRTDEIVIGKFLPLTAVTPYALADRLSQVPQMLTDQFVKVLVPLASELHAHDDLERLRFVYLAASRLTLAIFLPIGSIFIILAGPILAIWVGSEYADAGLIVAILTVASLFETSQWPAMALLQGVGRHHPLARMWVGAAVANLALSIVLVHTSLGVVGVALGTLVPTTVVCSAFVLPYAMRTLGVDLRQIASQVVWPAVRPAIPAAATLWLIHQAVQPMPLVGTILASAWTVCLYAVLYFVLGATALERHLLHDARLGMGRLVHAVVTHD
jgi:O-antigen/teichoic acid export membrane protein